MTIYLIEKHIDEKMAGVMPGYYTSKEAALQDCDRLNAKAKANEEFLVQFHNAV